MSEPDQRPGRKGESVIEKQIREAIERGEFDHLPGRGKPLDLGENPFTPPDWRLAYKMLQDAGMTLDWIEQDKEIRRELTVLDSWFKRQAQWQREKRTKMKRMPSHKMIAERERLVMLQDQTCVEYRSRATALNKWIDVFNLKVPSAGLQRKRIQVEGEIQRFCDACEG